MPPPTLLTIGCLKSHPDTVPIQYITNWIRLHNPDSGDRAQLADRILIVQSQTGSGKSTVLPVALFRILRSENTPRKQPYRGKNVLCTQPRVLTAMTLSRHDIPRYNPDIIFGETIGYQTGPATEKPPAGLIFATIGVLAAQLRTLEDSEIMSRYKFIIVDEAHERTKETDTTLMRLKKFYMRNVGNPNLPFLLLTSATIDVNKYAKFFNIGPDNIVIIVGRTFPIEEHYPDKGTNDYVKEAVTVAMRIHDDYYDDKPEEADIMIFVPGATETIAIVKALSIHSLHSKRPFLVLPISRDAIIKETPEYRQVLEDISRLPLAIGVGGILSPPSRRIIVTTAVAETGLTVPTLKYIIDSGWSKSVDSYPPYGISGLIARPAPKSRILQRKGRVGRIFPGEFYPLYTINVFNSLETQQLPEIITSNINDIFLDIVQSAQLNNTQNVQLAHIKGGGATPLTEFRIENIDMLDVPPVESIRNALEFALMAGFVSPNAVIAETFSGPNIGYGITYMGRIAGRFSRTPMEGVRAILSCYVWQCCVLDMITIVALFGKQIKHILLLPEKKYDAILASLPIFLLSTSGGSGSGKRQIDIPSSQDLALYRSKLIIADDFIEMLFIFDTFMDQLDSNDGDIETISAWCVSMGLNMNALIDIARQRDIIIEEVLISGLDPFWGNNLRLHKTSMNKFTDRVSRIKQCLYDGLRQNVLKYDEKNNVYRTRFNLAVEVPPAFSDQEVAKMATIGVEGYNKPLYILTDRIDMKIKKSKTATTPILYKLQTTLVSVLDGFVDIDSNFLQPQ